MGDRTHCTLLIGGKLTESAIGPLVEAITDAAPDEFFAETIGEAIRETPQFEFYEMNRGEPPADMVKALIAAKVAYRWSWGDGGSYGPGLSLYDPATGECGEYGTLDGEIALRVADTENPDVLRLAERWLAFERAFPGVEIITHSEIDGEVTP